MTDAYSFGSNDDDTIGPPTPLKKFRQKYYEELGQKPAVYRKLMALTQAEVGNQGPEAQQAFLETVFNRAASRGQTLDEAMQLIDRGGYYPGLGDYNKVSAETETGYGDLLNQVRSGSNVGNYATGNASGTVGFNKGPQVAEYGGERYGIEGPDVKTMQGIAGGTIDPLEASTFDPTGRKRMANGDQQGILGALGMQNQQPQGLLGALGDPETMSYIAMMLKGMNPYSNLDPNAMLSAAHTNALRKQALMQQQAEQATDNRRADARLDLDKQRFGLTQREYDEQRAEAQRQQKAREDLYGNLPGSTAQTLDPSATPGEPATEYDKIRERIKYFEDRMGTLGPKDKDAAQKQIDLLNKRLQPSATELTGYTKASQHLPELESLKRDLTRAQELVPQAAGNTVTTYFQKLFSSLGVGTPEADNTAELDRKMQQIALTDLKKLLPGPASDRDRDAILKIAANPGTPRAEKAAQIANVLQRVEDQVNVERGTIKRFKQKEGTYRPEASEAAPAGGGTKAPDMTQMKRAPNGKYYVPDPNRPGGYLEVQP